MSEFHNPSSKPHAGPGASGTSSQTRGLQETDPSFHILFTDNPQPMWVYDLKTLQILEVNDAAIEHYGYSYEEFLSMRITDIRPTEDVPHLLENIRQGRSGLQRSGYWRHIVKTGQLIDVEITSHSLMFRNQQAELVVIRDITKEKKAEEALKQAEKKYRTIFEEAIVGIFQSTPDGQLVSANPAMARLYGYSSPEEMLASIKDVGPQMYVDPSRRDEFKRL